MHFKRFSYRACAFSGVVMGWGVFPISTFLTKYISDEQTHWVSTVFELTIENLPASQFPEEGGQTGTQRKDPLAIGREWIWDGSPALGSMPGDLEALNQFPLNPWAGFPSAVIEVLASSQELGPKPNCLLTFISVPFPIYYNFIQFTHCLLN